MMIIIMKMKKNKLLLLLNLLILFVLRSSISFKVPSKIHSEQFYHKNIFPYYRINNLTQSYRTTNHVPLHTITDITQSLYRINDLTCSAKKSEYTGVGARVAKKFKQQFRLENDSQVRSVRKAMKKFKKKEERRVIKARINTLKSQQRVGNDGDNIKESERKSTKTTTNPFTKISSSKKSKAKIGPKPIRLGLSLDMASDMYGGASLLKDIDPHFRKINTLNFIGSYLHTAMLPSLGLPEICLVGRSNVGKSSFINSLMSYIKNKTRKSDLAFVSKTPGYTKSINIFEAVDIRNRGILSLVDLPGYGFAKIKNKETRKTMQSILKAYLKRRLELKLVIFLVDGSGEPEQDDYEVLQYFKENTIPHLFILTKMDKVNIPQTAGQIIAFRQYFDLKSPLPLPFSKFGGGDLGAIWQAIFDACTDSFDVSKLNIVDKFENVQPDYSTFVKAQTKVSIKDLKKMIYKNFDVLPDSVKSQDLDKMDRDQLLDVLKLAADRTFELDRKPLDLVSLKHKLTKY